MKLIVISAEGDEPRETAVLGGLFTAGLERYHVRKPAWTAATLEGWLRGLPEAWRSRLIPHQHHELVGALGLGGYHWRDVGGFGEDVSASQAAVAATRAPALVTSRSCHDLATLRAALGRYRAVFFGPLFPSVSKAGYGPRGDVHTHEVSALLASRSAPERRTQVIALGGITAATIPQARALGFDGVAVLGSVWQAADPVSAFVKLKNLCEQHPKAREPVPHAPVMCLTQDGLPLSHVAQAERLCAAGARWIQLRMKAAQDPRAWVETARAVAAVCRAHGAICIVNDSVEVAIAADAHGAHLGRHDGSWPEARRRLGDHRLLGGTVNDAGDAERALRAGCLDYVGVGPWRFTRTKANLAPVLGPRGVQDLIERLGGLPAWVIGGIEPADMGRVRATGAAGAAVSSALFCNGRIEENHAAFVAAWQSLPNETVT